MKDQMWIYNRVYFAVFVTIRDFVARAKNNNAIESY